MKRHLYLLALPLFILSSCSQVYILDTRRVDEFNLDKDVLSKIQFYNTKDILLTRYESNDTEMSTEKGTLNVNYGKEVDQLLVKAGTKGKVVRHLEEGRIAVSFEPDDNRYIVFGTKQGGTTYYLQALEWKGERGKVKYGEHFYITHPGSDKTTLTFKLKKKYRENRTVRVAKGNKI